MMHVYSGAVLPCLPRLMVLWLHNPVRVRTIKKAQVCRLRCRAYLTPKSKRASRELHHIEANIRVCMSNRIFCKHLLGREGGGREWIHIQDK